MFTIKNKIITGQKFTDHCDLDGDNLYHNTRGNFGKASLEKGGGAKRRRDLTNQKIAFTLAEVFSPHSDEHHKIAFTLAEVLITLGIIGVVAAMTLPALISNYRKNLVESELKKTYSLLNQLMVRSEADNGSAINWEWQQIESTDRNVQEQFLQKYFVPYLKVVRRKSAYTADYDRAYRAYDASGTNQSWWYNQNRLADWIELADGTALLFGITNDDRGGRLGYWNIILPHTAKNNYVLMGRDSFIFHVNMTSSKTAVSVFPNSYKNWNCESVNNNRTYFNERCRGLASDTSGDSPAQYCTMLLFCNNWKVPDDYPIKF